MSVLSATASLRARTLRRRLLHGASAATLLTLMAVSPARAQLAALSAAGGYHSGAAAAAASAAPTITQSLPPDLAAAEVRAQQIATQATSAVNMAAQVQAAARAAAQALAGAIPNGLVTGGLQPAVGSPNPATQDPTGLLTWDGADMPTQTTNGQTTDVTITQTSQRAVLDWTTFNVGAQTSLTFVQKSSGVAQPQWVALNRVVGQIDPATGLRDPSAAPAPSQILGSIHADGTVLIINPNGILFGGAAQVDLHSLAASSLDVGRTFATSGANPVSLSLQQRNIEFLNDGLLGVAEQDPTNAQKDFTFSPVGTSANAFDPTLEGDVTVEAGAQITSEGGGFLLFAAPHVTNAGELSAPDGQVSLQSGREFNLVASDGTSSGADVNVRGLVVDSQNEVTLGGAEVPMGDYVLNSGLIEAPRGYISVSSTVAGGVMDQGVLASTTSVAENGFVRVDGGSVDINPGAVISVTPDSNGATIPQDATSVAAFKVSQIQIGYTDADVSIGRNALVYAPGGKIGIAVDGNPTNNPLGQVFIDTGAIIDAAGVADVVIPASRNSIGISPVKQNELADTPTYRNSFLNGATVYVDPRLSGVRSDGVAWVGSPLIAAQSYYDQVGVSAAELLTKGGSVTIAAPGYDSTVPGITPATGPSVTVKPGAVIDVSGGWKTYQAGNVMTTRLVDAQGQVVDIGQANPEDTYVGVYGGFTATQPRWGVSQTFTDPILLGMHYEQAYAEGADAGSLVINASVLALDGQVYAKAFAGPLQLAAAQVGTAASALTGDLRKLQAAPSQLPAGGLLDVNALDLTLQSNIPAGADISITGAGDFQATPDSLTYGRGLSIVPDGSLAQATPGSSSVLPDARIDTIFLSAPALSAMGLGQLTLQTTGQLTVTADADVALNPGAAFIANTGRSITVEGVVTAPSGQIDLTTSNFVGSPGSPFVSEPPGLGSFDVEVTDGALLSVAGRWVNDENAAPGQLIGDAYLNGGSISITAAPSVLLDASAAPTAAQTLADQAPTENTDISGSILVDQGATLNLAGGGYVAPNGSLTLTAKGGNLSLTDETAYFQLIPAPVGQFTDFYGEIPGFRVTTNPNGQIPLNPDELTARIDFSKATILAAGFGGGGTFTLNTPSIAFGDTPGASGTTLPLGFFSQAGFATYKITSYGTDLFANPFTNGLGGTDSLLATQILTVGDGQTLSLTQARFSPTLNATQSAALSNLPTGGDLYSVLSPAVPADAWDRLPVNLDLGGLIELHVASGGGIIGEAGGSITTPELFNEGLIRIPGGTLSQSQVVLSSYAGAVGIHQLSDVFTVNNDGSIHEGKPALVGTGLTNAQAAAGADGLIFYVLGDLPQGVGVLLAPGSVTDLSGASIINPRASGSLPDGDQAVTGKIIGGGALVTASALTLQTPALSPGAIYSAFTGSINGVQLGDAFVVQVPTQQKPDKAVIDLSGVADTYDLPTDSGALAPTSVWSNAGSLNLGAGFTLTDASISAFGGAPQAEGGALSLLRPTLSADDPGSPTAGVISAEMITGAGFDTFTAQGSITSQAGDDVTLSLGRAFFLTAVPYDGTSNVASLSATDLLAPTVSSGGQLEIDAPYIGFDSPFQALSTPAYGTPSAANAVTFKAQAMDVQGAVLFDRSVATANLQVQGDLRLIGVEPPQIVFNVNPGSVTPSLAGQLAVNGDLNITAGQVYPTTGTRFAVTSAKAGGVITFASASPAAPVTPYSAGGQLFVQAAQILQGGVIRVPLGALQLGANTAYSPTGGQFAPATSSVELQPGSLTSVSADGLSIPYGTTTDQLEWFFSAAGASQITAPPAAVLEVAGASVLTDAGAVVDEAGGGDVYAYEVIPGTGGSRDVLDRFNADQFSANLVNGVGYQYPDERQVYAIVPGLSNATAAAYDPIYSANYGPQAGANGGVGDPINGAQGGALYGAGGGGCGTGITACGVGSRVYLSAAPGLAAGWYTLLPAQYAMLPGGMRVVQDTSASTPSPDASSKLLDGTLVVAGRYGDAASGAEASTPVVFDVQPQSVFLKYSDIALASGNQKFAALAAHNGVITPPLPIDAGRLILDPADTLDLDATFETTPAAGGRGVLVDVAGQKIDIVSALPSVTPPDTIVLTADSLSGLGASSLLIGAIRTDNPDGTTSLSAVPALDVAAGFPNYLPDITAQSIVVSNDASHPLTAPDIILAVDGLGSTINVTNGSAIIASVTTGDPNTGAIVINAASQLDSNAVAQPSDVTGLGALLRISTGPQRQVERLGVTFTKQTSKHPGSLVIGGADLQGGSLAAGGSINLNTEGDMTVEPTAQLSTRDLALGAREITVLNADYSGPIPAIGLIVSPAFQAELSAFAQVSFTSPAAINFAGGSQAADAYNYGDLIVNAPGIADLGGGPLTISANVRTVVEAGAAAPTPLNTGEIQLSNTFAAPTACGGTGAPACGSAALTLTAASDIAFEGGRLQAYGLDGGAVLTAPGGVLADSGAGGLNFGAAALTINTPFIGDRLVMGFITPPSGAGPSLTLATTGAVTLDNPGSVATPSINGDPGSSLRISGAAISVSDVTLRATAGNLTLQAANGISAGGGAVLETPSYAKTFGDATSSVLVSAPGGQLVLSTAAGDIDLAGSTASVGGQSGQAGALSLLAPQGAVTLGSINGSAPGGGGSFTLDTADAFDLTSFEQGAGAAFTGNVAIHSGAGDLDLSSGEAVTAQSFSLTADGGGVDIGGSINVSGTNGGTVDLYGRSGVTLQSAAVIDAEAVGYGPTDTRQATGGTVTLGTDGSGVIAIDQGAEINLSAANTGPRLVPMLQDGVTYYTYVAGDVGGTLDIRAPVIEQSGTETVNVSNAGTVTGASSIVLEAFQRYDLGALAADFTTNPAYAGYDGVAIVNGQAVLDLTQTTGKTNFFADLGASGDPATIVNFIQGFNLSNSNLGDLTAGTGVFHARPGVELDYSGDIVLSTNWNLGAGSVDVAGAAQAGLMTFDPRTNKYFVNAGDESQVFSQFTNLTYRTDNGAVTGEPGVLTLRAGGTLDLKGGITDGFFAFYDQTDPNYLSYQLGGGARVYQVGLVPGCNSDCGQGLSDWSATGGALPANYVDLALPSAGDFQAGNPNVVVGNYVLPVAPYSANLNTAAATGSLPGGTGDALGSAELFPRLTNGAAVSSWSYNLVGGADFSEGATPAPSVNPLRTNPGSTADVIVEGDYSYSFQGVKGAHTFDPTLQFSLDGTSLLPVSDWLSGFEAQNADADPNTYTLIDLTGAPNAARNTAAAELAGYLVTLPSSSYQIIEGTGAKPTQVSMTLQDAAVFFESHFNFGAVTSRYRAPTTQTIVHSTTADYRTLARTGSGSINVAAAGDVNLLDTPTTAYRSPTTGRPANSKTGVQVGGSAIYTAGVLAALPASLSINGLTLEPGAFLTQSDIFAPSASADSYGAQFAAQGAGTPIDVLEANPVYLQDGGEVSITAGRDVLGRRDQWLPEMIDASGLSVSYAGTGDQPWRVGQVGDVTNIQINPQLFNDGIGALGGGAITVSAGRNVSDVQIVDDTSVITASVTGGGAPATRALMSFGGGDVTVTAAGDILGGQVDVASGQGKLSAGGQIASAGQLQSREANGNFVTGPDLLRLRLTDATVGLSAQGLVALQGIGALGVLQSNAQSLAVQNNLDSANFYTRASGVSILADGAVTVENEGAEVLTQSSTSLAIYPASFSATSITADLDIVAQAANGTSNDIVLFPSPTGELRLFAGGDIDPTAIAMSDADPGLWAGVFSTFAFNGGLLGGIPLEFPAVLPDTPDVVRKSEHNSTSTHLGDSAPNLIYAGADINDMILVTPKQTQISAGRDVVNMMFFGQNLASSDVSRIVAGRDIVGTIVPTAPIINTSDQSGNLLPAVQGDTFIIGGPGSFFLEAGRDMGPFLNSAVTDGFTTPLNGSVNPTGSLTWGGGVLSVGDEWNPWLAPVGASVYVEFGVGKGEDFNALREAYLNPANVGSTPGVSTEVIDPDTNTTYPNYGPVLISWMQKNFAAQLVSAYGTTNVTFDQAYQAFKALPELQQKIFLLDKVYFSELIQTSLPQSPSFKNYQRGYQAVNDLFPASYGYTKNNLSGGANGAAATVATGNLDLRLATIQTSRGGNIYILGPGGRVIAGSTVATAAQAARRVYAGGLLFSGGAPGAPAPADIVSIPVGEEGILTLRGGSINTFTDTDFLLNQSRLFTEQGGDIAMWSSNGNLNAGQGPKTSANFPPLVVHIDEDAYAQLDQASSVSGAGIAAFEPAPGVPAPNVFLIAPVGTVDAGSAGVRVAGNLYIAAQTVANADNFKVSGNSSGLSTGPAINVSAQSSANSSAAAAATAAQAAAGSHSSANDRSIISVDVLGYVGDEDNCEPGPNGERRNCQ